MKCRRPAPSPSPDHAPRAELLARLRDLWEALPDEPQGNLYARVLSAAVLAFRAVPSNAVPTSDELAYAMEHLDCVAGGLVELGHVNAVAWVREKRAEGLRVVAEALGESPEELAALLDDLERADPTLTARLAEAHGAWLLGEFPTREDLARIASALEGVRGAPASSAIH